MLPPIYFPQFLKLNQVAHLSPSIPTQTVSRKGCFLPTNFKKRASLWSFIFVLTQELWNQYSNKSSISFPCLFFSHCLGWGGGGGRQITYPKLQKDFEVGQTWSPLPAQPLPVVQSVILSKLDSLCLEFLHLQCGGTPTSCGCQVLEPLMSARPSKN